MDVDQEFLQLVTGLQSSAWFLMGKMANPMTGKVERNLDAVKGTIDTLSMLQRKMKGNLTAEEEKVLENVVSTLQLNYVDEVAKGDKVDETAEVQKTGEEEKKETTEEPKEAPAKEKDTSAK